MGQTQREKKEGYKTTFTAPEARILIVDDNRVNLKMAEGLLRPYCMQVETAQSGERAVEMMRDQVYDLIFLDYLMPGMNGEDTARMIRGMEGAQYRKPVIIALSANIDQEIRERCLEAGMNDFVAKPVERCCVDKIICKWLPVDMMIPSQGDSMDKQKGTENEDPFEWQMDGIDVAVGMSYSGNDRALYLEVLTDFADSIEDKADQIGHAVEEKDFTTYIMGVHSLKSAARYLGAATVADMAQALEADAKRDDWRAVERGTPDFLLSYRKLYQSIAPYRIDRSYTGKKKRFDRQEVYTLLQELVKCMDEYDIDGGEEITRALQEYDLGKAWTSRRNRIMKAVDQFEYGACKEEALSWKRALEKES